MKGRLSGKVAVGMEANCSWSSLRVNLEQELLAPVVGLLQYSEMLVAEAEERGYDLLLDDLHTIRASCVHVRELAESILEASQPPDEKEARHDLLNLLNPIIQYCEMLLEDSQERVFFDGFVPDLHEMLRLARYLTHGIKDTFTFAGQGRTWGPAERKGIFALPPGLLARLAPSTEKARVLVVDDHEINRQVLRRQLEREGHATATAANGRIALEMLREQTFDLVLLDILMPELDGFETLCHIKSEEKLRQLPVIMISALDEIDSAAQCIEYGAEDYLTKPCNTVLLHSRIGACLEKKRLRDREAEHLEEIRRGKERVDELLRVILPHQVVPELIHTGTVHPRRVENVAVLFADLVGFTEYCGRRSPEEVVAGLQALVQLWEDLTRKHAVQKIKTIGDALMAACGLMESPPDDPVRCAVRFGQDMIAATRQLTPDWSVRVGIHVGPVVAGVVGCRQYSFDLWGDTVNIASRMESHGQANAINLSPQAWDRVAAVACGRPNPSEVKSLGWTEMMILESLTPEADGCVESLPLGSKNPRSTR